MQNLWKWIAPSAVAIAGIAVLCLAAYPHCFFQETHRIVSIDGSNDGHVSLFSNDSSPYELVFVPDKNGRSVTPYSVDLHGEIVGSLDQTDITHLPRMVVVKDPSKYGQIVQREIYDPSVKPGKVPNGYHFTAGGRQVEVYFRNLEEGRAMKLPTFLSVILSGSLAIWTFVAPILFVVVGCWSFKTQSNPVTGGRTKASIYVLLFTGASWAGFVLTAGIEAGLQQGHKMTVASMHSGSTDPIWGAEVWVGVVGAVVCTLVSAISRGPSSRAATYASLSLAIMWLFVGSTLS